MMKKSITCIFCCFLFLDKVSAQADSSKKSMKFGYELIAKIITIDTVLLIDTEYIRNSVMPENIFKKVQVKLQLKSIIGIPHKSIPNMLLMDLIESDHTCVFFFEKGKMYRIYASIASFTSSSILKKYQKKFLMLNCFKLPTML